MQPSLPAWLRNLRRGEVAKRATSHWGWMPLPGHDVVIQLMSELLRCVCEMLIAGGCGARRCAVLAGGCSGCPRSYCAWRQKRGGRIGILLN